MQVAEVVKVVRGNQLVEGRAPREPCEHDDRECHGRQRLPTHDEHAVHRREPVRLERHEPVERRERNRQAVAEQSAGAEHLHLARDRRIAGLILFERPFAEQKRDDVPDREVDGRSREKERHIQVRLLPLQNRIDRHTVRISPRIQRMHTERDRNEEDRHQRQRAGRRAENASNDHTPGAAGHLVHHREPERAECNRQQPHVGREERANELRRVHHQSDRAHG